MVFRWILVNKFAIGTPILSTNDQFLLKDKKIKSVIDLRNEYDIEKYNLRHQLNFNKVFDYFNISLPDHNSKRLANFNEIEKSVELLKKLILKGPVFMHCHAAVERSPLISIAYLHKYKGLSVNHAYDYVKQQNETTNVSFEQLRFINKLEN